MTFSKKNIYFILFSSILVLWMERKSILLCTSLGYRLLEILFFVCMTTVFSSVLWYLCKNVNDNIIKAFLILLVLQTIAMLPLYTQNFMYGDDLWGFTENYWIIKVCEGLPNLLRGFREGFIIKTA